jgi:hypothetical protein
MDIPLGHTSDLAGRAQIHIPDERSCYMLVLRLNPLGLHLDTLPSRELRTYLACTELSLHRLHLSSSHLLRQPSLSKSLIQYADLHVFANLRDEPRRRMSQFGPFGSIDDNGLL